MHTSSVSHLTPHQELAATPSDSEERFRSRNRLPTFAKYLREVGPATPVVAGLVTGDKEGTLTQAYGGTGDAGKSIAVPIYESVGRVRAVVCAVVFPLTYFCSRSCH